MGFNNDNLPLERQTFFGKRLMPLHGIEEWEWWPTQAEEELVASVVMSDGQHIHLRKKYGSDYARVNTKFSQYSYYFWFVKNFTKQEYTDDYKKPVTIEMVKAGIREFEDTIDKWALRTRS